MMGEHIAPLRCMPQEPVNLDCQKIPPLSLELLAEKINC